MRIAAFVMVLFFLVSCEREQQRAQPPAPAPSVSAPVSDELPGLPSPATGIAFWDHPTLSFNGLLIVATAEGVAAYNMEDGNEISRIDGVNAQGAAVGYLGSGRNAAGFLAVLDADENSFRFYGIDNESRLFLPLDSGPAIRGPVRGFCLGRAVTADAPSLYVIQRDTIQIFNLAASPSGVSVDNEASIPAPDNLVHCAAGRDGALIIAANNGDLFRLDAADPFSRPLARSGTAQPGELAVVAAANPDDPSSVSEHVFLADHATGAIHVFTLPEGEAAGVVTLAPTDVLPGIDAGDVFGATGGNLGGLYRNGVVAFGVGDTEDGPVIRLAPVSGIKNALSILVGEPVSPRGEAATPEEDGLIIPLGEPR